MFVPALQFADVQEDDGALAFGDKESGQFRVGWSGRGFVVVHLANEKGNSLFSVRFCLKNIQKKLQSDDKDRKHLFVEKR